MTVSKFASLLTLLFFLFSAIASAGDITSDMEDLYGTGELDAAIEKALEKLQTKKRSADLRYFIGTCYEKKLDIEKAEEYYREALDKKSGHLMALYRLGKILVADSTKLEEAKGFFEEGLKRSKKDHEEAMFEDGLGLYYLALKEYSQADKKFRTAQFLDEENCDYPMHLGDANYEKGAYALAITSYNKVLSDCDSLNPEVHFRLGVANVAQKKYGEALKSLSNAIRFDSSYVEAYAFRGKINILAALSAADQEAALTKYGDAIWSFRKQIEFGYKVGEANYYLAKAFSALKYNDSASVYFEQAVNEGYTRSDLYLDLGKSYSRAGMHEKAIEALTRFEENTLAEDPDYEWTVDDAALFVARAKACAALGDSLSRIEAAEDFERAWSLDTTDVSWLNDWGFNYYYLGKDDSTAYEKGLEVFHMKLALDTLNARALKNMAYMFMRMKDWDSTAHYLKKVVELDPDDCSVNKLIASSLSQQKQYAESREYYAKWGECDDSTYEADKWIGFTYLIAKPTDGKNALVYLNKAYTKMKTLGGGECDDKDLVTWIAQAYAIDKKYEKSMIWIKKGLKCDPGSSQLQELRASVQEALDAY